MSREIQQIDATGADLRKYRTELPNLLDDAGLHPFAFRLLAHYYRRRVCWESVETTANLCKMAKSSVVKYRRQLEQEGWIQTERVKNPHGGNDYCSITVVDVWLKNFERYSLNKEHHANVQGTPRERARTATRTKERKEKKEPSKKGDDALTVASDSVSGYPSNLDTEEFRAAARRWVAHVVSLPRQTVTPSRITAWLSRCSKFGADVSIQVIDFAISGGKHDLYLDAFERFSDNPRQAEQQTAHHPLFEQLVGVYDGVLSPDSLSPDILKAIEATGYDLNQVLGMARDWFMGAYRLSIMEYLSNE